MVRAPPHDRVTTLALISRLASSGVSAMPSRFEKDALHTAAAILPRAIEVKAIDDCTVDGSKVRNRNPAAIVGSSRWSRPIPSPSSGKIRKVEIGRAHV